MQIWYKHKNSQKNLCWTQFVLGYMEAPIYIQYNALLPDLMHYCGITRKCFPEMWNVVSEVRFALKYSILNGLVNLPFSVYVRALPFWWLRLLCSFKELLKNHDELNLWIISEIKGQWNNYCKNLSSHLSFSRTNTYQIICFEVHLNGSGSGTCHHITDCYKHHTKHCMG